MATLEQQRALALARARLRLQEQGVQPAQPALTRGTRGALQAFLDNVLGLPDLAVSGAAQLGQQFLPRETSPAAALDLSKPVRTVDLAAQALRAATGGRVDPVAGSEALRARLPRLGERVLPIPAATDIFAGGQLLGEGAGALRTGDLSQFTPLGEARQQQEALQQEGGFAGTVGGLLGDAASLAAGRAPIARFLAAPRAARLPRPDPSALRLMDRFVQSKPMRFLASRAGRAAETGAEGAVLAVLNDGDPLEVASYGAAAQFGGSLFTPFVTSLKGAGALAVTAVSLTAMFRLAQDLTPGVSENLFNATDAAFNKIKYGLALGLVSGLAGAGRLRGTKFAEDLPRLTDGINALQRGASLSLLNEWLKDPNIEKVVSQVAQDPDFFGENTPQIARAIRDESVSLSETIGRLIDRDENFRVKLDSIGTRAAQVAPQKNLRDAVSADNQGATPVLSTQAAENVARKIPKDSPLRRSFERGGPRSFIADVFADEDAAASVLPKLSARERRDVLEVELSQVLTAGLRPVQGGRVIDGQRLQNAWRRLPQVTRDAYAPGARESIERFIGESLSAAKPLFALPPLLAHSLMMDGALTRRLRGNEKPIKE